MNTQQYFREIENQTKKVYKVAEEARQKGLDPVSKVEIPLAKSLAEKVVSLISAIYPQMENSGIIEKILELEKKWGKLDPAICLQIAEDIAKQKFCKFPSLMEAIEAGARTGIAYNTLGVVSSPIEGLTKIKLLNQRWKRLFFCLLFRTNKKRRRNRCCFFFGNHRLPERDFWI